MQQFKNSFKYGQTSESFAQSMLKGDLKGLKESSLKTCINGTPLGYEGIEQRRGYQLNSVINTKDDFKQFPLTLSKTQAQILIFENQIIINAPAYQKYFVTPLPQDKIYDITSIQDVLTNGKDQLFIASSRGIDVFSITDNFFNAQNGSNVLTPVPVTGLDTATLVGTATNVYYLLSTKSEQNGTITLGGIGGGTPARPEIPTFQVGNVRLEQLSNSGLSNLYLEDNANFFIGDEISVKGVDTGFGVYNFMGKVSKKILGYKFVLNGQTSIYPSNMIPVPISRNPSGRNAVYFNIPDQFTVVTLVVLSGLSPQLFDPTEVYPSLPFSNIVRGYRLKNVAGTDLVEVETSCRTTLNAQVLITSSQGISGNGFSMYLNTDNRLYISYDNIAKASEVGNFTNFASGTDDLVATTPLNLAIQGVNQIKWIWKLRDRGTLFGTDVGLKLLNYGANSFRLGISDISDIIPSPIRPISATINGIGGVAFANSTQDKIMFLASQSTLQTPVEDLTRFVDFFLNDKIIKLVSVPYRAGEMTMALTQSGKVYRLITGNNDKFGWTRDNFDIIETFPSISNFPTLGKGKVWYLDNSTSLYYLWINNAYVQTNFYSTTIYDISVYNNQLVVIFLINQIPNVQLVKVICNLDLTQNTTADLWDNIPSLDYNFDTPNNVFINQDLNSPVYYPSQIDISFKEAIIRPSEMFLETHYDEYVGNGRSSKTLNRQIKNRVIHGDNLYDVLVGYKGARINYIGNKEWFTFLDNKKYIAQTTGITPTPISGDIPIIPSGIARLITCTIKSQNTTPTVIRSEEYQIDFP